jgi:hypothetical protein
MQQQHTTLSQKIEIGANIAFISSNVEYYTQPNPKQRPLDETAGIPTGVAPDLQAAIDRRQVQATVTAAATAGSGQPTP